MNKEDQYWIYVQWCKENRCNNTGCSSNKYKICEDVKGIDDCKSHKAVSGIDG